MKNEIWKPIVGFEGLYEVSNFGRVKSLSRNTTSGKILKYGKTKKGYLQVCLCKDGKQYVKLVHRLVAEVFLVNPNNLPCINHLDENITNNNVQNLCWTDYKTNNDWGTRNERVAKVLSKPVLQCYLDGTFIREWQSATEVERQLGFSRGNISSCCRGECKKVYGFIWRYKNEE